MRCSHLVWFSILTGAAILQCAAPCQAQYYSFYTPVIAGPAYVPATQPMPVQYAPTTVYYSAPRTAYYSDPRAVYDSAPRYEPSVTYRPMAPCTCDSAVRYGAGYTPTYAASSVQLPDAMPRGPSRNPVDAPQQFYTNSRRGEYMMAASSTEVVLVNITTGETWKFNGNGWSSAGAVP